MQHRITYIFIISFGYLVQAQNAFYFGPQVDVGTLQSTSTHVRADVNPSGALSRSGSLPQWAAGLVMGGIVKNNDLSIAVSYRQQYLNHSDPNAQRFTNNASQYIYKAKISGLSTQFKYLRNLPLKEGIALCGGAGLQMNLFKEGITNQQIEATGSDANTLYFEHQFALRHMNLGIFPEIGLRYKLSQKVNLYLYGRYVFGSSNYAEGKVDRVVLNSVRVEQGQYSSKGSSAAAGLSLQFTFTKDQKAAQERLLAKAQKRKEKETEDSLKNALEQNKINTKANEQRVKDSLENALKNPTDTKVVTYDSLGIPSSLDNRTIDKQNEITVNGLEIELIVWDDKSEDGDSISLYLNGQWILEKYLIQKKKKSIKITLDPNRDNYLIMYALNEGTMPPNTCAMALDDGTGSRKLNLKSTMKSCAALHFKVKK